MATSGQIQTNAAFGYVRLAWAETSQSIVNNTSTISYTLSIYRSSAISSTTAKAYSITINGVQVASGSTTIGGSGTKTIKTGTATIPHNANGTKTFAYSFSQEIEITWSGVWIGTLTGSGNGTLDTIPRATTPTISPSPVAMGSALTITMNRASGDFTHTLTYSFGRISGTIGSNLGTSASWTVPLALAEQIPNGTTGTGSITCSTYNGGTLIGTKSVSFVATVPASVIPTIDDVAISEAVAGLAAKFGGYVQSKSKLNIVTTAEGELGSAIRNYTVTIRDTNNNLLGTYTGANVTTEVISASGIVTVAVSVTDSRGRTASTTRNVTIIPYTQPRITTFTAYRTNVGGTEDYEGQYVKFTVKLDISPVNNRNDKRYEIVYRQKGASTWSTVRNTTAVYTFDGTVISGAVFNPDNAYDVALNVYDYFGSSTSTHDIPTAFTLMDFRSTGKGVAFGKVSETDAFECALKIIASAGFQIGSATVPEPSAITANTGANFRKTAVDYEIVPMTASVAYGNKLTIASNGIRIGAGVNKIKVSAQICYGAATAGLKVAAVFTSASNTHIGRTQTNVTNTSLPESMSIPSRIIAVSAGEIITLRAYGTANDIIYGGAMQTYLTVEVLE